MELELHLELPVIVDFDVDPGQELILNPADRAQEGIEPSIEINSIKFYGEINSLKSGFFEVPISEEMAESIINECWNHLKGLKEAADESEAESRAESLAESHDRHW